MVTKDQINDIALLKIPTGNHPAAHISEAPEKLKQGEDVVVFGYPLNSILASGGNITPGIVSALTGLGNNTNQIQITAPIQPGSSGSPVLNRRGEVVAIVSAKLSDVKMAKESELVLVMESAMPDGSLKTWRKGVGEFWVRVKGRAAHAGGNHEEGRNAIEEMSHQVLAIQKLTDYEKGTTLNVGVVQGGTVSNVVPEEATAQVDVRVMQPGEWERLESEMNALKPVLDGTSLEISGGLNRPPMPFDDTMKTTFEKIKAIGAEIGIALKASGTGGGSDANFVAPLGIPVMDGLGAVGEGLHSEREYIFADCLEERARLLAAILEDR